MISITTLFFSTAMRVNVNGHFTDPIPQGRALHQGDPFSPILFNLALEPSCVLSYLMQPFVGSSLALFKFPPLTSRTLILSRLLPVLMWSLFSYTTLRTLFVSYITLGPMKQPPMPALILTRRKPLFSLDPFTRHGHPR